MTAEYPKTDELLAAIHNWSRPLMEHDAFRALARVKIRSALDWSSDFPDSFSGQSQVVLKEPLRSEHDAVMKFYNLRSAAERIGQAEYYFRRYPFRGGLVSRHDHLENICTMFFGGFYIFEERLEKYINALNG